MHQLRNQTLSRFLDSPGRFAIFGSDATGESVFDALADAGLKPAFFLDLDRTGELRGLEVLEPEAALDLDAVVTAGAAARDMTVQLRADGFEGAVLDLTDVHRAGGAAYHDEALIDAAADTIGFARSLLQDDGSREIFDAVLAYRRSLDPGELPPAPPGAGHPALPVAEGEWVVDLGSDPEALLALAEAVGPLGRVHALSPDPDARCTLEDAAAGSALGGRLSVHALGRRRRDASDDDDATPRLASVDDFVWEVTAGRIDRLRVLAPSPHAMLGGASATLAERRPRLVVALAARPADLWELPIQLKERCPGYRLHLGHDGPGATATRLYGRPPEPR
jgi:hypothetical protein